MESVKDSQLLFHAHSKTLITLTPSISSTRVIAQRPSIIWQDKVGSMDGAPRCSYDCSIWTSTAPARSTCHWWRNTIQEGNWSLCQKWSRKQTMLFFKGEAICKSRLQSLHHQSMIRIMYITVLDAEGRKGRMPRVICVDWTAPTFSANKLYLLKGHQKTNPWRRHQSLHYQERSQCQWESVKTLLLQRQKK